MDIDCIDSRHGVYTIYGMEKAQNHLFLCNISSLFMTDLDRATSLDLLAALLASRVRVNLHYVVYVFH